MATLLFVLFFLASSYSLFVHASVLRGSKWDFLLSRAINTALTAPDTYNIAWTVDGLRGSVGPTSGRMSMLYLAGETDIVQSTLQTCADVCTERSGCVFLQVILLRDSPQGNVVCAVYSSPMERTAASYATGLKNIGSVVTTYGLVKADQTTLPKTSTSGSSQVRPATTFPTLPIGGSLEQFQPCSDLKATIPMIVNEQYSSSDMANLYIVQHGGLSNPDEYFAFLYPTLGQKGILVSPAMYKTNDDPAPASWYLPDQHLAWQGGRASWSSGEDAVAPRAGDRAIGSGTCSSFDVYDALLNYFDDKANFPNLKTVYFIGHSGGANAISRYSQFYRASHPFKLRFVVANPANNAYATDARPEPEEDVCDKARLFPYQLDKASMNRYVSTNFVSWETTYKLWAMNDVVTLIGDADTVDLFPTGTQNCQSQAQGGRNRRDRNYAFWAYQNILFGTKEDVTHFYGYDQLIKSGAKSIGLAQDFPVNHQNCIVADVGHDAEAMFKSDCGHAAFFDFKVPPGAKPS